tara:strand:- start:2232 stop:2813 length:582 start_codon:yes stop_codon:yes gene_type:complete
MDITNDAFSNPHSGIIDIASAHKLTITRSLNVTDGSFSASFITQSESDNDFPSEVRISRSSFSYKLTDWSSFFTLFTSLFAALKNPEALAENDVLIPSSLFLLLLLPIEVLKLFREEEEREDEEEEVKEVFCVPLIFADDDFELVDEAFIPSRPLLFLNEEEKEEKTLLLPRDNDNTFGLPLVDGKHSIAYML